MFQVYAEFQVIWKALVLMLRFTIYVRYVHNIMVHGIFMFMHSLLFIMHVAYVFEKHFQEANPRSLKRKIAVRL